MAKDKIRLGIIGANVHYGWSMRAHLPALSYLPEFELTAVCTAHRETAEESANHYGARLAFHDFNEMVSHPDIDLVSVSVKAPLHYPIVMAALEAGKDVFCEWPLGINLAEAEEMADLARSRGVRTMIALQANCDPTLLRLQELVKEGYLGEVLACSMTMFLPGLLQRGLDNPWMADKANGANTLSIVAGHTIDVLCFCVGEFEEVSARVSTQVPVWPTSEPGGTVNVTSPDNVLVNGKLVNGAVASVHVSMAPGYYGAGWKMEIYGTEGALVASSDQMMQLAEHTKLQGAQGVDGELSELKVPERLTWIPREVPKGAPFNIAQMYGRLARAIGERTAAHPDFDLAVKRHRLLDAIQRSSDLGESVQISIPRT